MGIFPWFGGWISQNTQQPKKSENVKSKPVKETKTHNERDEMEQLKLWRDANKKKQYQEPPPTVKVRSNQLKEIQNICLSLSLYIYIYEIMIHI